MRQFGELEAVIMHRLWAWGRPALVREMVDDLQKDRQIAYTTVMTRDGQPVPQGVAAPAAALTWCTDPATARPGRTAGPGPANLTQAPV